MDGRHACLLRWVSAARGPCWPSSTSRRKKQLRVGTARGLCPRPCPEVSVCLGSYDRVLLRPSRCADLPTPTRAAGQHWPRRASGDGQHAPLAGSDDAEARWAASGRCGGFAQSCGRRWSSDRGRSDLCWRHQQGSCGPVSCVSVRASIAIWAVRRSTNEAQSPWRGVPLVCDTEPVWRGCPCVAGVLAGV